MISLELLAPARNADIGIAAIDCGADAVYIAGPKFGARQAAGNSVEDIRRLCSYAHRFGVRIYVTINTILYDDEVEGALRLGKEVQDAGADGLIVQDLAMLELLKDSGFHIPLHASTQCAIRTPEKARFYAGLGFGRLVLEREMSLDQIRSIHSALPGMELEFFIHGALCICYSGECYLSEFLTGRSANRGECAQACRSRYDLVDGTGKVLVRDKALLSLKDYDLKDRIGALAEAGICSFKIEGRLKNISYVRNVVREYSMAMDSFISAHPGEFRRASFGEVRSGFLPDPSKTFNRGYTSLFIDGKRGEWSSMDTPKAIGEEIGTIDSVREFGRDEAEITVRPTVKGLVLSNGDGFSVVTGDGISGFRGDVCNGLTIRCKRVDGLRKGAKIYRNLSVDFEREMERNSCKRLIGAKVAIVYSWGRSGLRMHAGTGLRPGMVLAGKGFGQGMVSMAGQDCEISATAVTEDGRKATAVFKGRIPAALNADREKGIFASQIGKTSGEFSFSLESLDGEGRIPLLKASEINSLRRSLAEELGKIPCNQIPIARSYTPDCSPISAGSRTASDNGIPAATGQATVSRIDGMSLDYKANVANHIAKEIYRSHGAGTIEDAYELSHRSGAELMRSKYCVRYELGLCQLHPDPTRASRHGISAQPPKGPLYLLNNGRRLRLDFDCSACEMSVSAASPANASD